MQKHSLSVIKKEGEYLEAFRFSDYAKVLKKQYPDRVEETKGKFIIHNKEGVVEGRYTDYFTHAPNGNIEIVSNFDMIHRYDSLGDNVYYENPRVQSGWMPGCGKNECISFLRDAGDLKLNIRDKLNYYEFTENGEVVTMPIDSVVVFENIDRENKEIKNIDFNVVSYRDFLENYDVCGLDTLAEHYDESLLDKEFLTETFYGNSHKFLTIGNLADFNSLQELYDAVDKVKKVQQEKSAVKSVEVESEVETTEESLDEAVIDEGPEM